MVGLTLALIVFALQSGGASAVLRRDLAVSFSFYGATNLCVALLFLTGACVVAPAHNFRDWLGVLAVAAAAGWALANVPVFEIGADADWMAVLAPARRYAWSRTVMCARGSSPSTNPRPGGWRPRGSTPVASRPRRRRSASRYAS